MEGPNPKQERRPSNPKQEQAETEEKEKLFTFYTGSSYNGQVDDEGKMTGFGKYRFPNGTEYHGHFKNGVFHGRGMIVHSSKFKMCGYFVNGKCDNYEIFFGDGLEYKEKNWEYCTSADRRFWTEIVRGISPVGETFITKDKPPRHVPKGHYDIVEGFYNPKTSYVLNARTGDRIRYVCTDEHIRILQSCRMNEEDFQEKEESKANKIDDNISTGSSVSND